MQIPHAFMVLDKFVLVLGWVLYVITLSFILWMLIDAGKHDRFVWIIIIIGLPILGAILYYFLEKRGWFEHLKKKRNKVE